MALLCLAVPASASGPALHGAETHPLWGSSTVTDFDRELDQLVAAGANTVRMDIGWSTVEEDCKGCYASWYISKADTFMQHAAARGIKVIPTLWSTPCWASSAPETLKQGCSGSWWDRGVTKYPPTNMQDYADIAKWVAGRWGSYLGGLEIWNEPNHVDSSGEAGFWKTPDQAGDYVRLIQAAYPAVKSATPMLPVVGGSLVYSDGVFLQALYDNGIKGYFDAFSVHPYTVGASPYQTRTGDDRRYSFISGVPWVHDTMLLNGDDKPIWLTELGFTSCNDFTSPYCVTLDTQAQHTTDAWTILKSWPYVSAATQYNLRNTGAFQTAMTGLQEPPSSEPPANAPPSVSLTSPQEGATFSSALQMSADATDDKGVARVEFWVDAQLVRTDLPFRTSRGRYLSPIAGAGQGCEGVLR